MPRAVRDPELDFANLARVHRRDFILMPQSWRAFRYRRSLRWQTVKFAAGSRDGIPAGAGVYAFLVCPAVTNGPSAAYLMYVGKTDSLNRRFGEYLRESRDPFGRVKLRDMFRTFRGHLQFTYARAPANHAASLENRLIDAFWPPVNSVPGFVRAPRRVLSL